MGKRFGVYLTVITGVAACLGVLILAYVKISYGWPHYIAAAMWGLADSTLNTSLIGLLVSFLCEICIVIRVRTEGGGARSARSHHVGCLVLVLLYHGVIGRMKIFVGR